MLGSVRASAERSATLILLPEARRSVLRLTATPVVLSINAAVAHADGSVFYSPTEGVYLVEFLPAKYVTLL